IAGAKFVTFLTSVIISIFTPFSGPRKPPRQSPALDRHQPYCMGVVWWLFEARAEDNASQNENINCAPRGSRQNVGSGRCSSPGTGPLSPAEGPRWPHVHHPHPLHHALLSSSVKRGKE
ncbi:hypothetical protein SFRURICE_017195, partial [Spodoptera frugiperda]